MFSTSMIASSTTSPSAMINPAITIVFNVPPAWLRTSAAASSESGIAVRLMTAVLQSHRNRARTMTTSAQPMSSARLRLPSDISMNVAGRKMVESTSTPASAGFRAARASSTSRVTCSVLPSGCFSTIRSRPGPPLMTPSPIGGGEPSITSATSTSRRIAGMAGAEPAVAAEPAGDGDRVPSAIRPRSAAVFTGDVCVTAMRWLGPSRNPPAVTDMASRVDVTTSCSVTPFACSRSGSTRTCSCRSRCPQIATFATPGTAISRGRTVHRASVVRSICESEDDDMPIFMTRLSEDSGDMMTGGRAAAGRVGATRARRSWTSCRAGIRSVPFSKISTTDDKPSTDLERSTSSPGTPFIAASSGTLMSASTSELESPGASVWISTSGGANSGNTSNGASFAALMPTAIRMTDSATTGSRSRSEAAINPRISYFPTPNSVPKSSAAPTVTTRVPAGGPCRSTAVSPTMSANATRWRTKMPPSRAS